MGMERPWVSYTPRIIITSSLSRRHNSNNTNYHNDRYHHDGGAKCKSCLAVVIF
jgi:hypothetical protein